MVEVVALVGLLLVAFAGGAFGAALGALPALAFSGFVIVAGEVAKVVQGSVAPEATTAITASIGLGPMFGPHVVFGGGAAAAAYAARKGYLDTGFEYYEAKHVTYALGARVDVLLVGGAFGVVGLLLAALSAGTLGAAGDLPWPGLPWDPVMASVVLSAFLHRLAFGYPLVGNVRGDILDMTPYERGERRRPVAGASGTGGETGSGSGGVGSAADAAGRYVVEPWLPHQSRWEGVALLGAAVGIFGAFVAYRTGSVFLAFGIALAATVFLSLGMERAPVTYHMAFPSSVLVVGLAGGATQPAAIAGALSLPVAVVAGAVMGAFAGVVGELAQRALYAHADTHLDPPAAAIVVSTFLLAVLDTAGLLTQSAIPAF